MGWSSWNTYGVNISEQLIKDQAYAMSKNGYKRAGYLYINIDDGFWGGRDENGRLKVHPKRFPNGLTPVVEYIHKLGLKAGIYSDGGKNTCASYHGGDVTGEGVGFYGHDQQDANFFFKEHDFDFIKVDFCGGVSYHNKDGLNLNEQERYRAIWKAIQNTGRTDVRMNICRWAFPGTWAADVSTSWRTTGDINCSWNSVRDIIAENLYLSAFCRNGTYNDMDMLEVGRGLSTEEDKTHFGMWCIMASPLLIGCNMTNVNTTAKNLMCNTDLIDLNQDSLHLQAYVVNKVDGAYILVKDIEELCGNTRAVALYNPTDASKEMTLTFSDIDLGGKVSLRDCFTHRTTSDLEGSYTVTVPAHGTRIYKATAEERYERTLYEAETAFLTAYQELTNNQTAPSAVHSEDASCSGGAKVGWLGSKDTNDLVWNNVYSKEGGYYTMTLKFSCGEDRYANVEVNGKQVKRIKTNSGGWGNIGSQKLQIQLKPGLNTVRLYYNGAWMADMDCMQLEFNTPLAINGVKVEKKGKKGIYTLNGVKLNETESLAKGVYIIDGKKRVVM